MNEKFNKEFEKEFDEAWSNEDYQKIMGSACKRFYNKLPPEEINNCKMVAVINFLKKYDISRNTKKTTYLHKCVTWECYKRIREENNFHKKHVTNCEMDKNSHKNDSLSIELFDAISLLSDERKELINKKFFNGESIKSSTDQKTVKKALKNLKSSLI